MLPVQPFIEYIKNNALLEPGDKILLAVSGGKDSALMVQLFKLAGYQFSIAHCNFNLRDDESQRDELFVKLLANSLTVPFHVVHFETKAYAEKNQLSTQMAARKLRYEWFEDIRLQFGYQAVALAHHHNDSIETLLLNLTRGTGISGMHGILPKRDHLVRPLLFLTRQQIELLVEENDIDFVTDSSNESAKYARNKIRLQVIPHLLEINPNLARTFEQNIARFAATEEVLKMVVEQHRQQLFAVENGIVSLPIEGIKQLKPQQLLFFELLRPFNFTNHVVNEILESLHKTSGTFFYSSTHRATIDRSVLLLSELIPTPAENHFFMHPTDEFVIVGEHKVSLFYTESNLVEANPNKAFVDLSKLIFPIIIRFKQDGDRFVPLGMRHSKKLSDFFIDQKIPVPQKVKVPLLINGNGEIIWVAGLRQDNRYKVNATTKKVAIFELSNL